MKCDNVISYHCLGQKFSYYGIVEVKKGLSILKKCYRIVMPFYNHGGFGWYNRRKMDVVDDRVCDQYIEVHPEITPYRKYGSPIYEKLCHTFTRPIATGEFVVSSTDPGATLVNETNVN